jgi:hypothetical protein
MDGMDTIDEPANHFNHFVHLGFCSSKHTRNGLSKEIVVCNKVRTHPSQVIVNSSPNNSIEDLLAAVIFSTLPG